MPACSLNIKVVAFLKFSKWQNKLPDDIVKKVNKDLNKEIIELGYNLNE